MTRHQGGAWRLAVKDFPVSNLPDPAETYNIGISFHSDGSSPFGVVQFGTK
jgi:hypothetical protein